MKLMFTENDIKKMVAKSVKKTILETIDRMELSKLLQGFGNNGNVGMSQMNLVGQIFGEIYGEDAKNEAFSSRNTYDAMVQVINNGTPEQERNFREAIGGWDVPDDMMYAINECVNKVVTKKLRNG